MCRLYLLGHSFSLHEYTLLVLVCIRSYVLLLLTVIAWLLLNSTAGPHTVCSMPELSCTASCH